MRDAVEEIDSAEDEVKGEDGAEGKEVVVFLYRP